MLRIGCELRDGNQMPESFLEMGKIAKDIGANTFQYTLYLPENKSKSNPKPSSAVRFDYEDISAFLKYTKENNISHYIAHAAQTMHLCAEKEDTRDKSIKMLRKDIKNLENLPNALYVVHPGSRGKQSLEEGIDHVINALQSVLTNEQTVTVLLETMSGKGNEVGGSFDEISKIINGVIKDNDALSDKIGVCFDTCHVFDAGYDIVNNLEGVIDEFKQKIGLDRLKAVHINDSKNDLGERKDRHEKIGDGYIGLDTFKRTINHPKLRNLPFILETRHNWDGYKEEIELLRGQCI